MHARFARSVRVPRVHRAMRSWSVGLYFAGLGFVRSIAVPDFSVPDELFAPTFFRLGELQHEGMVDSHRPWVHEMNRANL